jgi:hypothetical protein
MGVILFKKYFIYLFFIWSLGAYAKLDFEDHATPELITSARALAMGNVYMGKVDDSLSAFYNPAGLGSFRGFQFHLSSLYMEANHGFFDVTSGSGNVFTNTGKFQQAMTAQGTRDLLVDNPGNLIHTRVQAFPNITFRGFSLGYMYSKQNRARLLSADDDLELAERTDSGPVMSLNVSLFGGVFKIGVAVAQLTRVEFQKDFPSDEPMIIEPDEDYRKGSMTHVVAGSRLTLPIALLPTLSVVSRNATSAEFNNPELGGAPKKIPQTMDAGFSITPHLGRTSRLHMEVNYKDVGNAYDTPSARRIGAGIEFDFSRMMFVRFGWADGWGSAGVGVRNNDFIFDLTTYAVEASKSGIREQEDRRSVLSFSMGF